MVRRAKEYAPGALRVVVADDLGFMRIALRQIIETDGDMRVVGEARNGEEAVALTRELRPDIVTMDVEMPVMDGIEATRRIIEEVTPKPIVIMVSSHTQAGAAATLRALQSGAADFVSKQSAFTQTDLGQIDSELRRKIRLLAAQRAPPPQRHASVPLCRRDGTADARARPAGLPPERTGRPCRDRRIDRRASDPRHSAARLGPIAAPVVIAQHMPQFFTACLANSLSQDTGLAIVEGVHRQAAAARHGDDPARERATRSSRRARAAVSSCV